MNSFDLLAGLNSFKETLRLTFEPVSEEYLEFSLMESRLRSNLDDERRFGWTQQIQHDRNRIVDQLNKLALTVVGAAFVDYCEASVQMIEEAPVLSFFSGTSLRAELHGYLDLLIRVCSRVELQRIIPTSLEPEHSSVDLASIYVPLNTTTQSARVLSELDPKDVNLPMSEGRKYQTISALNAMEKSPWMVLRGGPGSGKSTFVNYTVLQLAQNLRYNSVETLPVELHTHDTPVLPIRIAMHDLMRFVGSVESRGTAKLIWDYLHWTLEDRGFVELFAAFRNALLSDGMALVCLDGLDEIPKEYFDIARNAVQEFAYTTGCRVCVTSRTYAYDIDDPRRSLHDFDMYTLSDLNSNQIDDFIVKWFTVFTSLEWLSTSDASTIASELKTAVKQTKLREVAQRPLLLTLLCGLRTHGRYEMNTRIALFDNIVEILLERWQKGKYHGSNLQSSYERLLESYHLRSSDVREVLEEIAFRLHSGELGTEERDDISEDDLNRNFARILGGDKNTADKLVEHMEQTAGLLVGLGAKQSDGPRFFSFPHRTLREFLTGCYLARLRNFESCAADLVRSDPDHWRETAVMAAATAGPDRGTYFVHELVPYDPDEIEANAGDWISAIVGGEALVELGTSTIEASHAKRQIMVRVRGWLVRLLEQPVLGASQRAIAGNVLGLLDDPRPGVNVKQGLPDVLWCYVPRGEVGLGVCETVDPLASKDEIGEEKPFGIKYDYWISKYPITQIQYQCFIKDTAHEVPTANPEFLEYEEMYSWLGANPPYGKLNHPIVLVTWHDARTFCSWLTSKLSDREQLPNGYVVRLPTEAEWEKVAKGGTKIPAKPGVEQRPFFSDEPHVGREIDLLLNPLPHRRWPWGEWKEEAPIYYANTRENNLMQTTAVGSFPLGVAPYGCLDMSGNAWSWTTSSWGSLDRHNAGFRYPYAIDARETESAVGRRVARGGSWLYDNEKARTTERDSGRPDAAYNDISFRVVVAPSLETLDCNTDVNGNEEGHGEGAL